MSVLDDAHENTGGVLVVYDGHCPFCQKYVQYLRLKRNVGQVSLKDARQDKALQERMSALGFDLDKGMVVKIGDAYYTEGDAMHVLALLSQRVDWWAKTNHWVFKSRRRAELLYPVLRFFRNLVLRLLRRSKFDSQ